MIVTVTPNPTWDVTYRIPMLVPGSAQRVREVSAQAGGKGVNVARVVRDLGGQTHVVAPCGGMTGQRLQTQLVDVPTTWIPISGETRTTIAVLPDRPGSDDGGQPTVLNEPGPHLTQAEWDLLVASVGGMAAQATATVIAGSLPPGVTEAGWRELVAAASPSPVIVDTSGEPLCWAAAAGATVVKANRAEAMQATGARDIACAARELLHMGAEMVMITDGTRGLGRYTAAGSSWARCPTTLTGNPTGAGDAATAALALYFHHSPEEMMIAAAAVSAASVLQQRAGAVDPDDVTRLWEQIEVRHAIN